MLKQIFKAFDNLNKDLENEILEISVKHSQMVFCFENMSSLTPKEIEAVNNFHPILNVSEITTYQDVLRVHIDNIAEPMEKYLKTRMEDDPLDILYNVILDLREELCQCPALEFAISKEYLKIYVPTSIVTIRQLHNLDKYMTSVESQSGHLELNNQRPYVLYVKDWEE